MNILHVLSQVSPTGAEFYACSLAEEHIKKGHQVYIVSDTLTATTNAFYIKAPISNRKYLHRWRNIKTIKKIIKEYKIDIVHAHSRAASWVCYFATRGTKSPLVSTVHGRQPIHTSTVVYDIYGDKVISICRNIYLHLIHEVKIAPHKLSNIPNGLDFKNLKEDTQKPDADKFYLSVFGRTNGPKGKITASLIQMVFPFLLEKYSHMEIQLAGGNINELGEIAVLKIIELNKQFGGRIKVLGFINDLSSKIKNSDLIICSGRIAIESLYYQVPTIAFGEGCYHGLVTTDNLPDVLASNFGDILESESKHAFEYPRVLQDIETLMQKFPDTKTRLEIKGSIENFYDSAGVADEVLKVYRSARMKKKFPTPIPVLMYHKIVSEEIASKHKIYITSTNFERHLKYLKKNNFTPITFKEYQQYYLEEKPFAEFPSKPIVLTFDDGYKDNYQNMLPLMENYGYHGVLFLLGDFTISYNFWDADLGEHKDEIMNKAEKSTFVQSGWEIGAHSMTHPDLKNIPDDQLIYELSESKKRLEQELGTTVVSFAYPTGSLDEKVKKFTSNAGYVFGVATDTGGIHLEDDRFQIFRINIFPHDLETQLAKKTASWYRYYYRIKRKK